MKGDYDIVIDFGANRLYAIIDLRLSKNLRMHISDLNINNMIKLHGGELDLADEGDFSVAVMAYISSSIQIDVLKALYLAGPMNMRRLSQLLNAPYSYIYDSTKDLCVLGFVEIRNGKVNLLGKVVPESKWQEDRLRHKDKVIQEIKANIKSAEKAEKKYQEVMLAKVAKLNKK